MERWSQSRTNSRAPADAMTKAAPSSTPTISSLGDAWASFIPRKGRLYTRFGPTTNISDLQPSIRGPRPSGYGNPHSGRNNHRSRSCLSLLQTRSLMRNDFCSFPLSTESRLPSEIQFRSGISSSRLLPSFFSNQAWGSRWEIRGNTDFMISPGVRSLPIVVSLHTRNPVEKSTFGKSPLLATSFTNDSHPLPLPSSKPPRDRYCPQMVNQSSYSIGKFIGGTQEIKTSPSPVFQPRIVLPVTSPWLFPPARILQRSHGREETWSQSLTSDPVN